MGIQINGTTDTISAVDGSLDINQNATFGNNVTIGGTLRTCNCKKWFKNTCWWNRFNFWNFYI